MIVKLFNFNVQVFLLYYVLTSYSYYLIIVKYLLLTVLLGVYLKLLLFRSPMIVQSFDTFYTKLYIND